MNEPADSAAGTREVTCCGGSGAVLARPHITCLLRHPIFKRPGQRHRRITRGMGHSLLARDGAVGPRLGVACAR